MLKKLLDCPQRSDTPLYNYFPVCTSSPEQLQKQVQLLSSTGKNSMKKNNTNDEFVSNQYLDNVKNQLILMKLKGFIDQKNIKGKSTEIKKLPNKVQFGTIIDGDPIQASKIRNKKKDNSLIDYFLRIDKETMFSKRKFTELQRIKQRHKKIKKRIISRRKSKKKNITS